MGFIDIVIIIVLILVVVLGGKKLTELSKSANRASAEFKKGKFNKEQGRKGD